MKRRKFIAVAGIAVVVPFVDTKELLLPKKYKSDSLLANDAEITIDIDQVGSTIGSMMLVKLDKIGKK